MAEITGTWRSEQEGKPLYQTVTTRKARGLVRRAGLAFVMTRELGLLRMTKRSLLYALRNRAVQTVRLTMTHRPASVCILLD
jgi:hypothetical protein